MTSDTRPLTRLAHVVAASLLAFAVGACSADPTPVPVAPDPIGSGTIDEEEPIVGAPMTAADRLVFGHPADATKVDPADVTDGESLLITWHVYEGLTRYVRGTTEVEPSLATSWDASDDGLVWTFNLREGVTFHDGTPFDADAVVWNFERWYDTENPYHFGDWTFQYWVSMFQGFADELTEDGEPKSVFAGIEAVDASTVRITLNRPNAPLLQNLAMGNFGFSSPAAVEQAGASYGTPNGNPIAAGTGPYEVVEWQKDQYLTLAAYDGYWGSAPGMPTIEMRVIPEGTSRYLALATGELDGMNQVNPEDIEEAASNPDVQVVFEPANNVGYLGFNQAKAPWGNLNCRLAVAHAIDKESLLGLYAGDAEVATQMMPPSLWGYNDDIEDHAYDPTLAADYMATCAAEETIPEEVVFYVPPVQRFYFPKPKELGELIQAALAGLGINADIRSPEWGTVWLPAVREGQHDILLLGWGGDNGDPDNFLCTFFCGGDAMFNSDADGNAAPADAALAQLLRDAATLSDQDQRRLLYEQANKMVHDEVLAVPLVHRSPPLLFRSNVSGYVPSPIQTLLTTVTKQ